MSSTDFIFLGTGPSSSLPNIECLTAPTNIKKCKTCFSTLYPAGKKNIRRNTSAVYRVRQLSGDDITIVIDVGKNFHASALEWFPKYGLRRIDALLLTHAHADAMNGLDDLRGWTLRSVIQPYIDIYLSSETYKEVCRAFPYLVSKEFATGGGDVPDFKYHIIQDKIPFQIGTTGIWITPFSVHHGRVFGSLPLTSQSAPAYLPTPMDSTSSTPNSTQLSLPHRQQLSPSTNIENELTSSLTPQNISTSIIPYISFGFKLQNSVIYISDVSHIPEETWSFLESSLSIPNDNNNSNNTTPHQLPLLIIDCLRIRSHTSHFGIKESIAAARRIGAKRTYMVGFTHDLTHEEYVRILEGVQGVQAGGDVGIIGDNEDEYDKEKITSAIKYIGEGKRIWARPAYDGLKITISSEGEVLHDGVLNDRD